MIDYIYSLVHLEDSKKITWYVGRTDDCKRRMREHRLHARKYKPGDEWKYEYASTLNQCGIKWSMEILMECGPDTEYYEDYFVNKMLLAGEPLQNMKRGDSEPWMGRHYASPDEFVRARAQSLQKAKPVVATRRRSENIERTLFADRSIQAQLIERESAGVREMRLRRQSR
jgi:hypothetical protein